MRPSTGISKGLALLDDVFARLSAQRGLVESDLSIGGQGVRLSFAGEALCDRLLPALAHRIRRNVEPVARILIMDHVTDHVTDHAGNDLVLPASEGTIRVEHAVASRSVSVFDSAQQLGVYLVPAGEELPRYERAAPLRTLLHWILEQKGCRLVHAAAVATPRGGALLAGRGGSGKSTTALLCLAAGLACAGDDYVGITRDGAIEAHAIYANAKLTAQSLALLPAFLSSLLIAPSGDEKGVLVLPVAAQPFPIRALIVPSVCGGRSSLRRISKGEALRALAPTTLFQLPGSGAQSLTWMADVVRSLPAFAIDLGGDRENIPELVARAIEESQ